MGPISLLSALSLTVIYRLTINLPQLPYSTTLRHSDSDDYVKTANLVEDSMDILLRGISGEHRSSVTHFRYHRVVGTLVYVDVYSSNGDRRIKERIEGAIENGRLANLTVSNEAFEMHVTRDTNSPCSPTEFHCLSGECIHTSLRCDSRRDCADGSDESKYARCSSPSPVIFLSRRTITAPYGGSFTLSAIVDSIPDGHQIIWTKGENIIGQGSLRLSEDTRITLGINEDEYLLTVRDAIDADEGVYSIMIDGLGVEENFHVSLGSDAVSSSSSGCPSGERACLSGHCLPVSSFCNRHVECPDGDDELHCTPVECSSTEILCREDNVCVPKTVVCDGWRDCLDGSDEIHCETRVTPAPRPIHKSVGHSHSRPTVSCEDGSTPEYSLHGSSYCWADAVCPPSTSCLQGLCCPSGRAGKRSVECSENEWKCTSGECIDEEAKCDRHYDCRDGSDEIHCEYFVAAQRVHSPSSSSSPSSTASPHSSSSHSVHSRTEDKASHPILPQSKEEDALACSDQEFRCPYLVETRCFHYDKLCDGVNDCGDGWDERNCDSESSNERYLNSINRHHGKQEKIPATMTQTVLRSSRCASNQFECRSGQCIESSAECNRKYDCIDGSDETQCDYFKEAMGRAESSTREERREGNEVVISEEDGGEEEEYPEECTPDQFRCASGDCIDPRRRCDGRSDCGDGSDESGCPQRQPSQTQQRVNDIDADDDGNDADYGSASEVIITVYPVETSVKAGQEVSFECRARTSDGAEYPSVSWSKVGGELSPSAHSSSGRLSISSASASDQGRYVCVANHGGQTFEAHASLTVRTGSAGNGLDGRGSCMADEKACSNNECVKSDYVCDGEPDCRDRSDEANCPSQRACEPNEFKCRNNRCIQKMWLCDGDDDCGDGTDEQDCGSKARNGHCAGTEFACHDGSQCVPTSFHCDGTNDCRDGSDEVGCVQPTVVQPPQTNMEVPQGGQFQLTCKAVAVPSAYINWRLNWGPVCDPPRCVQSSEGGTGTLTVNNAQPVDQGAYTCEAINVRGRVLATPDCIVRIVNQPFSQPQPTAPPQTPSFVTTTPTLPQIVNCDPRGSASPTPNPRGTCDCKPLVTGPSCNECRSGSYHLSPKAPQGCLKCFCFGVTDQCRSSSWFRTTESLLFDNNSEGITLSDIEERNVQDGPFTYEKAGFLTSNTQEGGRFWRMPQRFLGNKVTSYGGKMELTVESTGGYGESREPLVVLKGNQMILVHRPREQIRPDHSNKIIIETYEQNYEQVNGQPATREELLTVLADLDAFLIRASHAEQQTSTSLGDVSWQIAVPRDTSNEQALEVEQCSCPPGYVGTSCEDCAPGYERSGHGPYLGTCVPVREQVSCSSGGAISPRGNGGRCECKSYTTGAKCDQCTPNSFYLAPTNPHGCIPCFCSGVTQQCQSTNMGRVNVELDYRIGEREQLELSTSDSHSPLSPQSRPFVSGRDISFDAFHEVQGQTLYWKLPAKFLGNKVTSYGGVLKYIFKYTGAGNEDRNADVIIRGNDITLHLKAEQRPVPDVENTVEIKLFEDKFTRVDGNPATREHLLMALADLDAFLIKASYNDDCASSSLLYVSLEYAAHPGGAQAHEVEQCACPPGYSGTSCEDCAPGYSRTGGGLYLGLCAKCECNGHATSCNKEYGYCENCQHNTEGDQCERCKAGFVGDARRGTPHDCQPAQTRPPCQCHNHSPRGCDSFGRCLLCEHNTEGTHCERCKAGYYGDATKSTPFDCTPCPCPGSSDCFLDNQGQVSCRNCPAGLSGRLCNECAPGYTRNTQAGRQCVPIGRVADDRIQFVERPEEHPHGAPPQPMVDPPHTTVTEGEAASFRCWVPNIPDCQITWHKDTVGGPLPHGVYQTGNALKIPKAKMSDAGNYICTAQNQFGMGRSPDARLDVVRRSKCRPPKTESCPFNQPVAPRVDPPEQTVYEGEPARFRCWVPGVTGVELSWTRVGGAPLPHGARQHEGILHIDQSRMGTHDGQYECTARLRNDPSQGPMRAPPVNLRIQERPQVRTQVPPKEAEREPLRPQVDPPEQTVKEGDPATFRCWVPGHENVQIRWSLPNNGPLPSGVHEQGGVLSIPRVASHHQSMYLCTAFDPQTRQPYPAPPATLRIASSPAPQVDPADQTVNDGDPASIRCWVPGQPDAVLRWTRRDNGALPHGSSENGGVLSIPSMKHSDQGDFTCSATDPNGGNPRRAPNARINVRQPKRIEPQVDPTEQTIPEGKPFRIRCWVPGHPSLEVSWRKVDGEINDEASEDRGIVSVQKSLLSDGGNYVCSARDPSTGEPVDSVPALVNVKPSEPVEGPFISPDEQSVPEKDSASIKCWVPGEEDPDLTFFRVDGAPLPFGSSIDGGILSIPSAEKVDEGDYRCVYTRRGDDDEELEKRNSTISKLTVTSDNEPITVRVEPRVWNGKPGDKHQFKCIVTGNPVPTIQWSAPGGGPLPHDVTEMDDGILDFANGRAELNGDYTCTATNGVGTESDHGSVNIGNSLTVKTTPSGPRIIITVGEPLEVKCEAFGDPDPEVEWIHDPGPERGDLPDDYKPITISEQFIKHPSIGLFNAGVYTCKGSNSHATATKNIYIEVVEPSKVATISILGGSSKWFREGDEGSLTCTATGSHLIDRIEWVKVDDQLPTDVEEHNEPGLLHFSNFKKNYAGEYECRGFRNNDLIASSRVIVNSGSSPTAKGEAKVEIDGPEVRVVHQGDAVELTCSVQGDHAGETFEWSLLHGGSLIRRLSTSPKLRIDSINPDKDFGVYRCHVEDESGIVVGSAFTAVTIGYNENHSVTLKFDDKSDADLLCPVYSVPGSKVVWEKDGGEVPSVATPNGGKLHISPFDESVSGLYTCRVTIGEEEVTGYVQAQIFVPDTIIQVVLEASSESVNVGDRVWFDCKVTGDPEAQVEWVREEEDSLPPSAQVTASRLVFAEVAETDGGVYKCIARTKAGPLEARSVLNVGGKRKRKRNQRRRARHNRRHAKIERPVEKSSHSLFGSLFSSS